MKMDMYSIVSETNSFRRLATFKQPVCWFTYSTLDMMHDVDIYVRFYVPSISVVKHRLGIFSFYVLTSMVYIHIYSTVINLSSASGATIGERVRSCRERTAA